MVLGAAHSSWLNSPIFGTIGGVIALAAVIGFFVGWTRINMSKATIELQEANNNALKQQNEMQQLQIDKQATTIEGLQKQVAAQQGQIDTLKELASGKNAVDELAIVLAERHKQVMGAIGKGEAA